MKKDLEELIRDGDLNGLTGLLSKLSPEERQASSKIAIQLAHVDWTADRLSFLPSFIYGRSLQTEAAAAAALGCCTLTQLKRLGKRGLPRSYAALKVLSDRNSEWLDVWAGNALRTSPAIWPAVRLLIRAGRCATPEVPEYTMGLTTGIKHSYLLQRDLDPDDLKNVSLDDITLVDALQDDPDLLDRDLWKIFEITGTSEFSLGGHDSMARSHHRYSRVTYDLGPNLWSWSLAELSKSGKLARKRLLDCCLTTLVAESNRDRARPYRALHDELLPTTADLTERSAHYLSLLPSPIPELSTFARKIVSALVKGGHLKARDTLAYVPGLLAQRAKAPAKDAVKLLDYAFSTKDEDPSELSMIAADGLAHPSPDLHSATIERLENWAPSASSELVQRVSDLRDNVAPTVRHRVDEWLAANGSRHAHEPGGPEIENLVEMANQLDPPLAELAAIPDLLTALAQGRIATPEVRSDGTDIPRLEASDRLEPIADLDELIEACAARIEAEPKDEDDIERCLDGILRMTHLRPTDFERRTSPLRKRLMELIQLRRGINLQLALVAWLRGVEPVHEGEDLILPLPEERLTGSIGEDLTFEVQRVMDLCPLITKSISLPLPALPTHKPGWIDPPVLVERLIAWQTAEQTPTTAECALAFLRLAPEHRSDALKLAQPLRGEIGDAMRYCLGGDAEVGDSAELWAAAARTRSPWDDDPAVDQRHPDLGPDAGLAARYKFSPESNHYECIEPCWHYHGINFDAAEPFAGWVQYTQLPFPLNTLGDTSPRTLTEATPRCGHWDQDKPLPVALHTRGGPAGPTLWPLVLEPYFAKSFQQLNYSLQLDDRAQVASDLPPLLDQDVPLRPMTMHTLLLSLGVKDSMARQAAVDAASAAIEDGRLGHQSLAAYLGSLLRAGVFLPNRLAASLSFVAAASRAHSYVVSHALLGALQGEPPEAKWVKREMKPYLDLLLELLTDLKLGVDHPATRAFITALDCGGKTGTQARALLALKGMTHPRIVEEVMGVLLSGRIVRVRRWQDRRATATSD